MGFEFFAKICGDEGEGGDKKSAGVGGEGEKQRGCDKNITC